MDKQFNIIMYMTYIGSGPKPVEMKEVDEGIFECAYVPKEQGAPCRLDITYDDEPVPGR